MAGVQANKHANPAWKKGEVKYIKYPAAFLRKGGYKSDFRSARPRPANMIPCVFGNSSMRKASRMNASEFDLFALTLRSPSDGKEQGYYPTMPWNDRVSLLWYKTLQRFAAAKVLRALDLHVDDRPRITAPTLDAFLRDVQALVPPPAMPWQQFPQETTQPMEQAGYGPVLRSLLLPQDGSQAWAKCWIWLFEQELTFPGREAACATAVPALCRGVSPRPGRLVAACPAAGGGGVGDTPRSEDETMTTQSDNQTTTLTHYTSCPISTRPRSSKRR